MRLSGWMVLGLMVATSGCANDDDAHKSSSTLEALADAGLDAQRMVLSEGGVCLEFCAHEVSPDGGRRDAGDDKRQDASVTGRLDAAVDNDAGACTAEPEQLARSCTTNDDCVSVSLPKCCFSDRRLGLSRAGLAALEAKPPCAHECLNGCAYFGTEQDDEGRVIGDQGFAVACVQGSCRTRVNAQRFACGAATCIQGEYCEWFSGGLPSSQSGQSCKSADGGTSCAALDRALVRACSCRDSADGGLQVSCSAP